LALNRQTHTEALSTKLINAPNRRIIEELKDLKYGDYGGTHIVTKIKYGVNVLQKFIVTSENEQEDIELRGALAVQLNIPAVPGLQVCNGLLY
jgi:hypothetical protein